MNCVFDTLDVRILDAGGVLRGKRPAPRPVWQPVYTFKRIPAPCTRRTAAHAGRNDAIGQAEWSPERRRVFTDKVIQSFAAGVDTALLPCSPLAILPPDASKNTNTNKSKRSEASQQTGLQSDVVAHLLSGGFDEEKLAAVPVNTLNWAVKTLGRQGRLDLADQLFHWMRVRRIANEHSFVQFCEACESGRSSGVAIRTWRMVRRVPTYGSGLVLRERAAAAVLKTFRPNGDIKGARRMLAEFVNRDVELNQYAFNIVIRIAADCADIDTAMEVALELRAFREKKFTGETPFNVNTTSTSSSSLVRADVRTISALLSAVAASEKWSRVSLVHKYMLEEGIVPDATLCLQLMEGYAGAARPESAEAVLDTMIDGGIRPGRRHWNALLSSYAQARLYDGCLKAYGRMTQGAGLQPDSYTAVALLHAAAGARAGHAASRWVLSMMEEREVSLTVEVGTALIACCRHCIPGRDAAEALQFAKKVMDMLRTRGEAPNIRTYNSLMAVQADAQNPRDVEETLAVLEATPGVDPNEATWQIALSAFQTAGWFDRAQAVEALRDTWRVLHGRSPL